MSPLRLSAACAGAVAVGVLGACHEKDHARAAAPPVASGGAALDARADAGPPSRCALVTSAAPPEVPLGVGVELGEAAPFGQGLAIGALSQGDAGRYASILETWKVPSTRFDLGPSWGDAPAPQPFVHGEDLYAVAYVRRGAAATSPRMTNQRERALSLYRVGTAVPPVAFPKETDASAAYDVVSAPIAGPIGALVAWDDLGASAGTRHARGIVQVATLSTDLQTVRAVRPVFASSDVPTEPADASDPHLVARPAGYWLTWLARRAEHPGAHLPLPAGEIETPSEEPTFAWVEALVLDASGAPVGSAKRLTARTGHVGTYAVAAGAEELIVVIEDDGGAGAHGGGSVDQIVWAGDKTPVVTHLVRTGVEEDTPPVIFGSATDLWLSFVDVRGDTEALPLEVARANVNGRGPASEPILATARVLGGPGDRLALAALDASRWTLRWASCAR